MVDEARTEQAVMAVVVRYDEFPDTTPDERVALMSWHLDAEAADREAARLNAVRAWEGVVYFVKLVRDPKGRDLPG
ncbi:hypothetical protein [Arthrobacter oryzae]|uniref:hypothetical protein n=1 Tax=Arthrobacter oryzae TaxID=409290 RepID=UPI00273B9287|nr:hypothetical protein [Arthrobacter oryzae]WLQ07538.1 hypothetical protein Q8Z05_05130 [Arthrobacter oryzae]